MGTRVEDCSREFLRGAGGGGSRQQLYFPLNRYGIGGDAAKLQIDVHPHSFLGRVNGCSTMAHAVDASKFSTVAGLAPTFILDRK